MIGSDGCGTVTIRLKDVLRHSWGGVEGMEEKERPTISVNFDDDNGSDNGNVDVDDVDVDDVDVDDDDMTTMMMRC
uniref:Uncharacterized protein n=1 Tax=Setaria digitata TaxID=48799 RepID=A0A915PXN9_9BILA